MAAALGPDWPERATYRRTRGEGFTDRHGDRPDTPADRPAPTVTGKARSDTWVMCAAGRTGLAPPRDPETHPADTITSKGTAAWVLRNGSQSHATERGVNEPARTVYSSRSTNLAWALSRPATTVQGDGPETVRVSVAEAACLQGFRADYPWQGTRSLRFHQVGNAVPPPLAAAVVGHLLGVDWQPVVAGYLARTALAPDRVVA